MSINETETSRGVTTKSKAAIVHNISSERIRAAINGGQKPSSSWEMDTVTRNFADIMARLNRLSPNAHDLAVRTVFNGNRSTLSKFTNPRAKDRRKKIKSYLEKVDAIGQSVQGLVDYPADKMVLHLVRETKLAEISTIVSSSAGDKALDDLWSRMLETAAYIDRETGLYEKFEFLETRNYAVVDSGEGLKVVMEGQGDRGLSEDSCWRLMLRFPFCHISHWYLKTPATIHYRPWNETKNNISPDKYKTYIEGNKTTIIRNVNIEEYISLVLRPDFDEKQLRFAFETSYKTKARLLSDLEFSWEGRPFRCTEEGPFSIPCVRGFLGRQEICFWAEIHQFDKTNSYVGNPVATVDGRDPGPEHHFATRYELDAWNFVVVDLEEELWGGGTGLWDLNIPTDLGVQSLSHALEYLLIDTAEPGGHNEQDFFLPEILSLARERAGAIEAFRQDLKAGKTRARERLQRIFDGDETLDP